MQEDRSLEERHQNMSPSPRKEPIQPNLFHTPKKHKYERMTEEQPTQASLYSPNENLYTPKLCKQINQNRIENQSTQAHLQSPFSPQIDWKTPQSVLKSNLFGGLSDHSTPNTLNKSQNHTPISPYSDRYIPMRQENISRNLFQVQEKRNILPFDEGLSQTDLSRNLYQTMEEEEKQKKQSLYQSLLQETLLDIKMDQRDPESGLSQSVLQFKNNKNSLSESHKFLDSNEKVIKSATKKRKIETAPFKVLDAPGLQDDFYQDVLHWGKNNLIAVGLNQSVYLYNYIDGRIMRVGDSGRSNDNYYTSLQWNTNGNTLAIGGFDGSMMLWDCIRQRYINRCKISTKRIASISWANPNIFACGTKEKSIIIGDMRTSQMVVQRWLNAHTQEVCGVTFNENEMTLASGGNDNKVHIWSLNGGLQSEDSKSHLIWSMKDHKAAVRALSWNPNTNGILVTGGGSADKTIKISNTLTSTVQQSIEVDSQVCKIAFSRNTNEIVSAHGYEKHQIMLWNYPQVKRVGTLEGHQARVLYMAFSPDDQIMVSGSGDETLKFWNIFPKTQPTEQKQGLLKITEFR